MRDRERERAKEKRGKESVSTGEGEILLAPIEEQDASLIAQFRKKEKKTIDNSRSMRTKSKPSAWCFSSSGITSPDAPWCISILACSPKPPALARCAYSAYSGSGSRPARPMISRATAKVLGSFSTVTTLAVEGRERAMRMVQ